MTQETNFEVTAAGQPKIDILTLTTIAGDDIDLTPLLAELNLFEDIFSTVLTGNITIVDNLGLFNQLPIAGNETLTVKFYSYNFDPDDPIDILHKTFDIIRITDIHQENDFTKIFTMHFASPELKRSESLRISKGYQNTTISNVVARLMTEDYDIDDPAGLEYPQTNYTGLGINFKSPYIFSSDIEAWYKKEDDDDSTELFVEKTKYTEPVISFPFMKPFEIIDWLTSRSIRSATGRDGTKKDNEVCNFVFFENKRGYQFISIDTLLETKAFNTTKFRYGNATQNVESEDGKRRVFVERIQKIQIQNCYDILSNMRNGMYASRLYTYDIATGQTEEHNYNYLDSFDKSESTERSDRGGEDFPLIKHDDEDLSQRFLAKRMFAIVPPHNTDNITAEQTERSNSGKIESGVEEYLQRRLSQLQRLNTFRVLFEIQANSKHKVGDVVAIDMKDWISSQSIKADKDFIEESNKYYSGNYLITSIKHTLTKFDYKMNVEAVKDSFKAKIGT